MATKRISALTAAASAALTDQIPIEDNTNATKRLTLTQVFALAASQNWSWSGTAAFGAAVTMASTLAVTGLVTLATLPKWSTLTPGSIPFGSTGGQLAQNNSALFWDSANARLGIGTATPARALDVTGTFGATGAATLGSTLAVTGATTLSSTLAVTGAATLSSTLGVTGTLTGATGTFTTLSGSTAVYAVAAPSLLTSYAMGTRKEYTSTSSTRGALCGEIILDPSASSSAQPAGVLAFAQVKSGNANDITTTASGGLVAVRAQLSHAGSGTVTAGSFYATFAASATGTLTDLYGLYLASQTAATNNWGVYQLGTSNKNLFAGPLVLGSTSGPTIKSGTGSPEGVETANVGSLWLRTNGGVGSTFYVKQSGTGNTGWAAVA